MTIWRKVLAWETVPEAEDYATGNERARKLDKELQRLKDAGDESVHTYSVYWYGSANGTSYVLGRDIEEAKLLQEYGLDSGFSESDTDDWESHGIHCDDTNEEEDW